MLAFDVGMTMQVQTENHETSTDATKPTAAPTSKPASKYSKRYFGFRLAAILLGLLPFLLLELGLSVLGWQQPNGVKDPYVGFAAIRPLFVKDEDGSQFEIAEYRKPLFCPDSFPAIKSENEFRIFCLGGSTVQGRPFAIETSFTTWLEQSLAVADDSKQWNVINCGGVSYASYRLAPIMEEVLGHEPDLIILYTGHNEFLEDRTYESIKSTSPWIVNAHERLSRLKTYSFLRSLATKDATPPETTLSEEVEARLDFQKGLEKYNRDDQWKAGVVEHFEHNLRRMLSAANSANVPVILCNPVCNLRDASPFKSENTNGLSVTELAEFKQQWESIQANENPSATNELAQLEKLVKLNPRHAGLQYRIGQRYLMSGDVEKAKQHLIEAKEQDVCPLRIVEPMYQVIENVRSDFSPMFVDAKALIEARDPDGIPGRGLLLDHVHPTIHGHQLIAGFLLNKMVKQGLVERPDDFETRKSKRFEAHLSSLPHLYFQLGMDRLAGLKRWAEGKVTKEKKN